MRNKPATDDDRALLEQVEAGDERAIARLYDRYSSLVYSIACRILGGTARADTVLEQVFLEIWRAPQPLLARPAGVSFQLMMMARSRAIALRLDRPPQEIDTNWACDERKVNMIFEQARAGQDKLDKLSPQRRAMLEHAFFDVPERINHAAKSSAREELAKHDVDMRDLATDAAFARRHLHQRDAATQIDGMNRLANAFAADPTAILQEVVKAAVELCGADSAGVSVAEEDNYFRWVATAGVYAKYVGTRLPHDPSPCGVTLERGCAQVYRLGQGFFDMLGVNAPLVTDAMLFPWQTGETRGTIWVLAHGREEAFDAGDAKMMEALASFSAIGVKLQQQHELDLAQARTSARQKIANRLAHEINNPLQELMQIVYLFGRENDESELFARRAMKNIDGVSNAVKQVLTFAD